MNRVPAIEGLRGLLALWVVFGHTAAAAGLGQDWRGPFKAMAASGYAVDVFMMVSGFVIFYLLTLEKESYGRFIWRRFLRLYPAYLFCLLLAVPILGLEANVYAGAPWFHQLNVNRAAIAGESQRNILSHLCTHLAMIHGLVPDSVLKFANYGILPQAWSLSVEWQFYLLAPLLVFAVGAGPGPALAVMAVACFVHFIVTGNEGFLPRHIPMFALGVASFLVWRQGVLQGFPLALPAGIALVYLVAGNPAVTVWAMAFLSFYAPDSLGAPYIRRVLTCAPMQTLGRLSYSIYLSHSLSLSLSLCLLEGTGAKAAGHWPFFGFLLTLTLVATLYFAAGLHRFVEAPCIRFGRRSRARGPELLDPAAS